MALLSAVAFLLSCGPTLASILEVPPPVIYKNGPGKCNSNMVKCKEIARLDWCMHICLYVFEGYLNLNISFTVWAFRSDHIPIELGAIEDDPESQENPPTLTGKWFIDGDLNHEVKIYHYRHSTTEAVHFFHFEHALRKYSGNIMSFDHDTDQFVLHCFEELGGVRTENSLIGYMNSNGSVIEWTDMDIYEEKVLPSVSVFDAFKLKTFKWNPHDLPRSRGCHNWGPLSSYSLETEERACQPKPEFGQYNGDDNTLTFTDNETSILDQRLIDGESPCPVCEQRSAHEAYYACVMRFRSMKAESQRCDQIASKLSFIDGINAICKARLQLCVTFDSVSFTAAKIEICPVPTIRLIKDGANGFEGMMETELPEANPVIFGCIDFPVTDGLTGSLNPNVKKKFVKIDAQKVAWYIEYYETAKLILFTIVFLKFVHFLLKGPSEEDLEKYGNEEMDDAKFFEEYGDFYTDDEEDEEDDMYDEMF